MSPGTLGGGESEGYDLRAPLSAPILTITPSFYDFGEFPLLIPGFIPGGVQLANMGDIDLTITDISLNGDSPPFSITSAPTLPLTLPPGGSTEIGVKFRPREEGAFTATVVVASTAGPQTLELEGTGAVPDIYLVTKATDTDDGVCDADCSLREAIAAANVGPVEDSIRFDPSVAGQTIAFAPGHGALTITAPIAIDGTGLGLTVDAQRQDRVFYIPETAVSFFRDQFEIIGLTITGGLTEGSGGGIYADAEGLGPLVLTRCTVTDNEAGISGGGVSAHAARVFESTISSNLAAACGGVSASDELSLSYSTISGNRATGSVGGVCAAEEGGGGHVTITRNESGSPPGGYRTRFFPWEGLGSSIIAGNTVNGDPLHPEADCQSFPSAGSTLLIGEGTGCLASGGNNVAVPPSDLFTQVLDPLLAYNGGPTPTHALLAPDDDPALNPAVDFRLCFSFSGDQRGFPPFDGDGDGRAECDAGSFELTAADLTPAITLTVSPDAPPVVIDPAGGSFPFTATLTNTTNQMQTVEAWTAALLPDHSLRLEAPLLGPVTVVLGPGETLTRTLVQTVPPSAPAGGYTYAAYVGGFDGLAVLDRDTFVGEKAASRVADVPSGEGEWMVVDVATGEPVKAGDVWRSAEVTVASSAAVPTEFALSAAYPNPFRSSTEMSLAVPTASEVRVSVYDVLGRRVAVLLDGEVEAGTHRVTFDGSGLPSGVYLVRAEAGGFAETQRVMLVR